MSDQYKIYSIRCAYCGKKQDEVYYTEGCDDFKCQKCKKKNLIAMDFIALKGEKKK